VYGLYAPVNAAYLRGLGADTVIGGEFEGALTRLAEALARGQSPESEPDVLFERLEFVVPDRRGLPSLDRYARLVHGDGPERIVGATEASRGCKHRCRHCPIVPVYGGRFRVVPRDVVLEDVRRQVEAGATHITFADPDFLNGIGHALPLARALHEAHPGVSWDATIKVEHLLQHVDVLPELRSAGCLFITSAVESVDNRILEILDKGHTRADIERAVRLVRSAGMHINPTFVAFTPWISRAGYTDLLDFIEVQDLVESVASIQLAIRLLLPAGSLLLDRAETAPHLGTYDEAGLAWHWRHPDESMDELQGELEALVAAGTSNGSGRRALFEQVRARADARPPATRAPVWSPPRGPVPYLTEPWYC
jgi:hypothetical protein